MNTHTIDWDKIKTVDEIKMILKLMNFEINPKICPIDEKYLKLINPPKIIK